MASGDGSHVGDIYLDVHPDTSGFEGELKRKLERLEEIKARVRADVTGFKADLKAKLKAELADVSVNVGVTPDTSKFEGLLRKQLAKLPSFGVAVTPDVGNFKRELESKLKALGAPRVAVGVDLDTSSAATKLAAFTSRPRTITVKLDADNKAALAAIRAVDTAAQRLRSVSFTITANTGTVRAALTAVEASLRRLDGRTANIRVTVNNTAALASLAAVDTAVNRLSGQRVRIDVGTVGGAATLAALTTVQAAASALSGMNVRIHVEVTGNIAALGALAAVAAAARALGAMSPTVNVNTNTSGLSNLVGASNSSRGAIQALIAAAIAIGPAIVPAAAAAVAALGAIGPAAFAGAAGIGVLALAFSGVFDAVSALGAAQSKAGKSAATYASQQAQIANAQDQVRDAHRGVIEAERNLANAQRDAKRAQDDINRARKEAKEGLEDLDSAVKTNSLSIRQANLDLADAEKALKAVQNLPADNRQRVEAQLRYDQAKQNIDDLTTRQGRLAKEQQEANRKGVEGSDQVKAAQERAADAQERVRDAAVGVQRAQEQVITAQRNLQTTMQSTSASSGAAVDTLREKMEALSPAGQKFARFLFGLKDEFKQVKAAAEGGLFPGVQAGIEAFLPVLPQVITFVGRVAKAMGDLAAAAGKALASPFWQNFFDLMGQVAAPLLQALGGILGGLARGFASLLIAFTPFSVQFTQGMAGLAESFAKWAAGLAGSNGFTKFIGYVQAEGPKVLTLLGQFVLSLVKLGIALAPLGVLVLDGLVALFTWIANAKPGTLIAIAAALGVIALVIAGLGGPITLVVAALVAIAGAAAYAYAKFEPFRTAVNSFVGFLRDVAVTVFNAVKLGVETLVDAFRRGGDDVQNSGFLGAIERLGQNARNIFDTIKAGVEAFVEAFKKGGSDVQQGGFLAYMSNLGMVARTVFDWIRETAIPAIADLLDWLGPKLSAGMKIAGAVLDGLFTVLNRVFGFIMDHKEQIGAVFSFIGAVIGTVFTVVGAIISFWWNYIVEPIFKAIAWVIENIVAPVFTWLWHHVIEPVWAGIRFAIDVAWAVIQVIFGLIQIGIKVLAAIFEWLYDHVIKPVWDDISTAIEVGWNLIRPIFELFGNFISEHVAPAFSRGVDALMAIWGGISDGFKIVVRFVVEDLLNNGLLKAYNTIAKIFNVKPDNVSIDVPFANPPKVGGGGGGKTARAMATGGFVSGPGGPTSDSILARLSNGEYVIPANVVASLGVDFFDWLIGRKKAMSKNQKPGDGSEGLAFADGGLVGWITGSMKSLWNTFTDPIKAVKDKILEYMADHIPGFGKVTEVAVGASKRLIDGVMNYLGGKIANMSSGGYQGPISADVAAVRDFIRAQAGKPYIWASAGPTGYDCSGIISAAYNALHGRNPYNHTFSTHYMHNYFTKMGQVGPLTAGWSHAGERGGGSVGHTAGNIAGLPFESRGSTGVIIGDRVNSYGSFARWGTFANGGLVKVPYLYRDQGGHIPPGLSLVDNRTGSNEWLFNDSQTRDLVGAGARRGGGDVHIENFNAYADQSPTQIAKDLYWESLTR